MKRREVEALFLGLESVPLSEHMANEVAAVFNLGRTLAPGEAVPGCPCSQCGRFVFPCPTRCYWCLR